MILQSDWFHQIQAPEVDRFSHECYQALSSPHFLRREPGTEARYKETKERIEGGPETSLKTRGRRIGPGNKGKGMWHGDEGKEGGAQAQGDKGKGVWHGDKGKEGDKREVASVFVVRCSV